MPIETPFANSFSQLQAVFNKVSIPINLFHTLFMTTWSTWQHVRYDPDLCDTLFFLLVKLLCRGKYHVIQSVERVVSLDMGLLKEKMLYDCILLGYSYYTQYKMGVENTLILYSDLERTYSRRKRMAEEMY